MKILHKMSIWVVALSLTPKSFFEHQGIENRGSLAFQRENSSVSSFVLLVKILILINGFELIDTLTQIFILFSQQNKQRSVQHVKNNKA
jgi:hypothetical protein